jgi:hypothetical protein
MVSNFIKSFSAHKSKGKGRVSSKDIKVLMPEVQSVIKKEFIAERNSVTGVICETIIKGGRHN